MVKIIVHIDLNYFFVRCEEIKDPSLIGKPVAVGHQGRAGIVSTCSYKAREYGVRSGMAMFQATKLCPNLIIRPVDFDFYGVMSKEFYLYVRSYTNKIEMASIDECYADFSDVLKNVKDPIAFFKHFQKGLYEKTKLFCSIGVATNKFLAKMGSDFKKPHGITILRKKDFKDKIYPLNLANMYGIGRKTAPRLQSLNINTIGDLAKKIKENDEDVKNILGKFYFTIEEWLNGDGDDTIHHDEERNPKSIGTSTTLKYDTNDYLDIRNVLKDLSKDVSNRIKKEGKLAKTISLTIKDTEFVSKSKSITLEKPLDDDNDIFDVALDLLDKFYDYRLIRLLGITLSNFVDLKDIAIQMTFFDYEEGIKQSTTKLLINQLNRQLSKPSLKRACDLIK